MNGDLVDEQAGDGPPRISGALEEVLSEAKRRGLIGGEIERAVDHARGFAGALALAPGRCLDLGSGGGLPGLVLAEMWEGAEMVLLDGSVTRAAFLSWAVQLMGVGDRVEVRAERAEVAGRAEDLRGTFDAVVARSFGPPAVAAECAAPMLKVGGQLVVSEPPDGSGGPAASRWPAEGVEILGLELGPLVRLPFRFQVLTQGEVCPSRFPRRVGVPAKRPLF